jgi:hypothetical protein
MFSLLRNRLGVPGVIAIMALVLAMAGGAWAAKKYVITSTNQIKPSVLKKLTGAAGPAGPAGAAGAKGDAGANGVSVTSVAATPAECPAGGTKFTSASGTSKACNGEEGEEGPEGSPWVVGQIPSGKTIQGTWVIPPATAAGSNESFFAAVSTVIPIGGTEPIAVFKAPNPPFCPEGTAAEPKPGFPGALCVFVAESTNLGDPANGFSKLTASHGGAVVALQSVAAGAVKAYGSWAMKTP